MEEAHWGLRKWMSFLLADGLRPVRFPAALRDSQRDSAGFVGLFIDTG